MPYKRTDWRQDELIRALQNPTHAPTGPHAHSSKHAVQGELAHHPLFQHARVTTAVYDDAHRDSNLAVQQDLLAKKAAGQLSNTQFKKQMKKASLPAPEVGKHSTLDVVFTANALLRALKHGDMQPHLGTLDGGDDVKVHVNFRNGIGDGLIHEAGQPIRKGAFRSLFIYMKPNPGNRDLPIFQTVVPSEAHKSGGGDPILELD